MSSYNVNIFASFNVEALVDPQQQLSDYGNVAYYLNTVPGNQTCTISAHEIDQITSLSITSNGINDGNFVIYPIKYTGEKVNFAVQLMDNLGYEVKDYQLLPLSSFYFKLSGSDGNYINNVSFYSNFGTLSSLTQGGFFKGLFTCPTTATNVSLLAVLSTNNLVISGYSNTFSVYSSGGLYQIRKVNENFDQTQAFISLAYQPALYDKPMLFNQFLGQIVGNVNSDPNTLGIETFEKISNYISNVDDVDYSNINQLKSLLDNVNATYKNFNYQYPPSLRRLTDILSVKHKNLFGQTNQYQGNFDTKGFIKSPMYGLNLGEPLPVDTTELSAGPSVLPGFIVVYETFSKTFDLVTTNLINLDTYTNVVSTVSAYPLSSVSNDWGWNLVLPPAVSGIPVSQYYKFYKFVPGVEGTLLQKFIDFDNPNNTLSITNSSYSGYVEQGGIMDNILLYNLYTSLEVLS